MLAELWLGTEKTDTGTKGEHEVGVSALLARLSQRWVGKRAEQNDMGQHITRPFGREALCNMARATYLAS